MYHRSLAHEFKLSEYDYVIDAIDSLTCKINLIKHAMKSDAKLYSAMGAANKLDPTQIKITSIWDTRICTLAKVVRKKLRRWKAEGDCLCVSSEEAFNALESETEPVCEPCSCESQEDIEKEVDPEVDYDNKAQINGSLVHITGFALAGLIIQDILSSTTSPEDKKSSD